MDTSKIVLLVVIGIVGIALVAFVVHTIRCYLNKPSVDQDEDNDYRVQFNKNENIQPI